MVEGEAAASSWASLPVVPGTPRLGAFACCGDEAGCSVRLCGLLAGSHWKGTVRDWPFYSLALLTLKFSSPFPFGGHDVTRVSFGPGDMLMMERCPLGPLVSDTCTLQGAPGLADGGLDLPLLPHMMAPFVKCGYLRPLEMECPKDTGEVCYRQYFVESSFSLFTAHSCLFSPLSLLLVILGFCSYWIF